MARARFQIKAEPSRVRADSIRHQYRGQAATDTSHPTEACPSGLSPRGEQRVAGSLAYSSLIYQMAANKRKHAQGSLVRNQKVLVKITAGSQPWCQACLARGGNDVKSVRAENEFLRCTAARKLLSDPIALGIDRNQFTWNHRSYTK